MLSIREGWAIAERQAWAETGKKHRVWFTWGRRVAIAALIGSPVAALGYAAYWAWHAVGRLFADEGPATAPGAVAHGVPSALIVLGVLLVGLTFAAFRIDFRRFSAVAAVTVALVISWCGVIAYGIGTLG